jgi:hypothetical protein
LDSALDIGVGELEFFLGVILTAGSFIFMMVTSHMVDEHRVGEYIPMFWEKE